MNRTVLAIAMIGSLAVSVWLLVVVHGRIAQGEQSRSEQSGKTQGGDDGAEIMCVGRVEAMAGEVDVSAQMAGTLESVNVREGEHVVMGTILATVEARREKAQLELAQARYEQLRVGTGAEEIEAARAQRGVYEAQLRMAELELKRAESLRAISVISEDDLDAKTQRADGLRHEVQWSQKKYQEAMKRGAFPQELAVACAEVQAAKVNYEMRKVVAPFSGTILQLCRHAGDQVLLVYPTPILRIADTNHLQVRLEINEADVYRVSVGMVGAVTALGCTNEAAKVSVRAILPAFGPRRLFDPDTTSRFDTRVLQVLCDIADKKQEVFSGQRVTVRLQQPQRSR